MSRYRKFYAALTAVVAVVVAQGILTGTAQEVAVTVASILGALGVVLFPNDPPPALRPDPQFQSDPELESEPERPVDGE